MTRQLPPVEWPRGPWFLSSRAEIDEWARERWDTLSALLEAADTSTAPEPEQGQLELGRAA